MMTVNEVSKLAGVSIRTLQYYDKIGLLNPVEYTESGYRMYDDTSLERLQQILLFKELQFSLKDIKDILDSSDFNRNRALEQQITLLTMKKEHLENLILFARGIQGIGVKTMDFSAFDTKTMDEYARQAKETYGNTKEYKEYEEKRKNYSDGDEKHMAKEMMELFQQLGQLRQLQPSDSEVQNKIKVLHEFINEHFYTCSMKIFAGLGKMYAGGGSITENIDAAGGEGTGKFVAEAIRFYCGEQ